VPAPNPVHPVDYLAWLNDTTETIGTNAGPMYEAAIENAEPWKGPRELRVAASEGDPDALKKTAVQDWIAANQDAIRHFRRATRFEFQGFKLDSPDGSVLSATLPALPHLRELASATSANGRKLAATGNVDEALGNYLDTLTAGGHIGNGPTMIENLVGMTVQSMAAGALMDAAAGTHARNIDYRKLTARIESAFLPVRPLTEAIQFERAVFLDSTQRLFDVDAATGKSRLNADKVRKYAGMASLSDSDVERLITHSPPLEFATTVTEANAYYDALTEAAGLPYQESRRYMDDLSDALEGDNVSPLLKLLTPNLARVRHNAAVAEATRRAALLTAHLLDYQQRFGEFPASLESFGEREFVIDQFTGKRFVYRRTAGDFLLYSLAGNGRDDGGVHDPRANTNDLVFRPRPR
jgi:hypothetical protein